MKCLICPKREGDFDNYRESGGRVNDSYVESKLLERKKTIKSRINVLKSSKNKKGLLFLHSSVWGIQRMEHFGTLSRVRESGATSRLAMSHSVSPCLLSNLHLLSGLSQPLLHRPGENSRA